MGWAASPAVKELLVALRAIAEVRGAGGGVVVNGSVDTRLSVIPSVLTCNWLEPAIPEEFVLSDLTLSEPLSPEASPIGMVTPLTGNGLPLSLSNNAAAKIVFAGMVDGGSVLKLSP